MDLMTHSCVPPGARLDRITVHGRFSYGGELNIQHGDELMVTPDVGLKHPNDLIITFWNKAHFIRRRRQLDCEVSQDRRLYPVDHKSDPHLPRIIGRVVSIFRIPRLTEDFF